MSSKALAGSLFLCLFVVGAARAAESPAPESDVGAALQRMYEEDQAERKAGRLDPENDAARLATVRGWVLEDRLVTGEDHYHAAMIFQHSTDRSGRDHLLAHVLATTAALKGHDGGRWLSAAALDRFLDFNDMPQFFGTQYERDADGRWRPGTFDPARVESVRALFGVATQKEAQRRADSWN